MFPDPLPDVRVPLDELAERTRRLGPRWEVLAQDTDLPSSACAVWRFPSPTVWTYGATPSPQA
jgi:hypothetical protein